MLRSFFGIATDEVREASCESTLVVAIKVHPSKAAPVEVVPDVLRVVFLVWAAGFGETVFPKFVTLLLGAVLTTGRRTVRRVPT